METIDKKEVLQDTVDKLLFWALEENNMHLVKDATELFLKGADSDQEMIGFNDWFVHDYRTSDGNSLSALYIEANNSLDEEKELLLAVEKSVYSAFDRMPIKDKMVIKDLFTKVDYQVENNFTAGGVMLARIYKLDGKHLLLDLPEFLTDEYKTTLIKGMLEKYNEYCRLFAPIQMDVFVKKHSQVLYRFLNIIENTATEYALVDEDFTVHQSTYVTKKMDQVFELMKNDENFTLALEDAAGSVFKLVSPEHGDVIAEIVLADDRLEIECTTAEALEYSKEAIEDILKEKMTHLRDEVLNIDDLIGQ